MATFESPIIMWSVLITVFCAILALHIFENKKINFNLSKTLPIFSVIAFSFILIAVYDWKLREAHRQLDELQDVITINDSTQSEPQDVKQQNIENTDNQKEYYPPIIENDAAVEEALSSSQIKNTIQDIFGNSNSRNNINDIKGRYEELLATYFLMEKCGKANNTDYQIIILSLQKDITAIQAPVKLQDDTLTAAKGSYEELYSQNDCSKSDLQATEIQYKSYINSLTEKYKN